MRRKNQTNRDPDMLANFEHIEAFGEPNQVTKDILKDSNEYESDGVDIDDDSSDRNRYIVKQIKQDFKNMSEEDQEKFLDEIFS